PAVLDHLEAAGDTLTLHAAGDGRRLDLATWGAPGPAPGSSQSLQRDLATGNWFVAPETPGGYRPPAPGGSAAAGPTPTSAAPAPPGAPPSPTPAAAAGSPPGAAPAPAPPA